MNILITGASGLLGINLAFELARKHTVFGTVNQHRLGSAELPFRVIQCDLLQPGALENALETSRAEWVIHCAALANVDACETEPIRAEQLNSELPYRLASYVARGGARLVHISTDAVFDGLRGNYSEDDQPNPQSVYARTKLVGERLVMDANPEAVVARVNLFGWGITGRRSLAEFFYNHLSAGKSVLGFTDVIFCPVLANDLAEVLEKTLAKQLTGLYHMVGSQCLSKYEFGLAVARRFGLDESLIRPASVQEAGLKAARSPNLSLRTTRLADALGMPLPGLSTGLERLYTLYQQGYPHKLQQLGNESTAA